jgi:hypothetical protein
MAVSNRFAVSQRPHRNRHVPESKDPAGGALGELWGSCPSTGLPADERYGAIAFEANDWHHLPSIQILERVVQLFFEIFRESGGGGSSSQNGQPSSSARRTVS